MVLNTVIMVSSLIVGIIIGILSNSILKGIRKIKFIKYKSLIKPTVCDELKRMDHVRVSFEDFKHTLITQVVYNIFKSESSYSFYDFYDYVHKVIDKNENLQKIITDEYDNIIRELDNAEEELMENVDDDYSKTTLPNEVYDRDNDKLTDPFRM